MGQFGITIVRPAAASQLGAHDTKVSNTPTSGTYSTIGNTVTLTPASDERVEITSVTADLADDNAVGTPQVRVAYTTQPSGGSESAELIVHFRTAGNADSLCTSNTFTAGTYTPSPTYEGPLGTAVDVKFKHWVSAGATTTICSRNRRVNGNLVRVVNQALGGQFRGSF